MEHNAIIKLIEDIEDNLTSYISDIEKIIDKKNSKTVKIAITTNLDKTHDASEVAENIMNNPDYIIVDVRKTLSVIPESIIKGFDKETKAKLYRERKIIDSNPELSVIFKEIINDPNNEINDPFPVLREVRSKNEVCVLPKDVLNSLCEKTQLTHTTIKNIKNSLIALQYTDAAVGDRIIKERLLNKIYLLDILKKEIKESRIIHPCAVQSQKKLLEMIDGLMKEIKEVVTSSETPNKDKDKNKKYTHSIPLPSKKSNEMKSFSDYLICDNKDDIINKLRPLFSNAKGKKVSAILLALNELKYIILSESGKQSIYKSVKMEFDMNFSISSCYNYIRFAKGKIESSITDNEIKLFQDILTS
jgi:hypothetical protein